MLNLGIIDVAPDGPGRSWITVANQGDGDWQTTDLLHDDRTGLFLDADTGAPIVGACPECESDDTEYRTGGPYGATHVGGCLACGWEWPLCEAIE